MTHTTAGVDREHGGSSYTAYHTIDITGTDGTNYEGYSASEVGGSNPHGVSVVGQADPAYRVLWDTANERLAVTNADGTAFAATGETVGEVTLRVEWG